MKTLFVDSLMNLLSSLWNVLFRILPLLAGRAVAPRGGMVRPRRLDAPFLARRVF